MRPHIKVDPRAPFAMARWICTSGDGRIYSGRNPSIAFNNWLRHQPKRGGLRGGGSG